MLYTFTIFLGTNTQKINNNIEKIFIKIFILIYKTKIMSVKSILMA